VRWRTRRINVCSADRCSSSLFRDSGIRRKRADASITAEWRIGDFGPGRFGGKHLRRRNDPPQNPKSAADTPDAFVMKGVVVPCCNATAKVIATETIPGSGTSLAQVQIQVPSTSSSTLVPLEIADTGGSSFLIRGSWVLIWTKPAN